MCRNGISKATLSRIPVYLELLRSLSEERYEHISATSIARKLSLGEVQVRKDLASISGAGKPKLGYVTAELIENLENCLGSDNLTSAVLVGAGKLGKALLDYDEFEKFGIRIAAAFDSNNKVLNINSRISIQPIDKFENIRKHWQDTPYDKDLPLAARSTGDISEETLEKLKEIAEEE